MDLTANNLNRQLAVDDRRRDYCCRNEGKDSMRPVRVLLPLFVVLLGLASTARAAIYTAPSCSTSDVQAAINSASDGDTVIIPNGSCTWTSGISTAKQITLRGASVGGVTITYGAAANSPTTLMAFTIGNTFHTRVANLRFMPGTCTTGTQCGGVYISLQGTGQVPLMHDMYFNLPNFGLAHAVEWKLTGGVIWNTTFESTDNLGGACGDDVGSDSGSLLVKSSIDWDAASTLGTLDTNGDKNLYIEDSTFSYVLQAPDVDDNGRVVIRHNQFIASGGLTHGTTSVFGGRQVEIYDNVMTFPNPNRNISRWFWFRGGTGVITGNNVQALNGPCYPGKDSWTFTVENAKRGDNHGCCTGYMCFHQPGSGSDGTSGHTFVSAGQNPDDTFQIPDPVYVWGNSGDGASILHLNDADPVCPGTFSTTDFFQSNRDYFLDSGPKPGWTRYSYPHPLRRIAPAPPTNLRVR